MDELTQEFIAESQEGLDRMERCLTELEVRPGDSALLGDIFRAVHTIKGTTGFLGFSRLEKLSHAGENLLGALRDGKLLPTEALISGLLRLLDQLRIILRLIEETGGEGTRASDDDSSLIALLASLNQPSSSPAASTPAAPSPAAPPPASPASASPSSAALSSSELSSPAPSSAESTPAAPSTIEAPPPAAAAAEPAPAAPPAAAASVTESGTNDKTLRINVEVLNRMMNLVGDLVLTRNQILQSDLTAAKFPELTRRLDGITADLRETVMQARMQPVGHLFQKFPRLVRDLAKTCGRTVRLEFSGQETGLDKSLLEALKDPLTHAVRNAVDHGIESPADRLLAGKTAEGCLQLKAFHQSGSVVIEISDDGAGIAMERVLRKAVERQLVTADQAAAMTEREALQLIFLPGFSTAAAVTNVSGRGVGMDVVRFNVEKVGGSVEIESRVGLGTTLRLRVPLTLAIVPALVVRSGTQSFALPQNALMELVYVPARDVASIIERIGSTEFYRLRDRLLPMVWLDRLLEIPACEVVQSNGFYLVVLEAEGRRYGMVVDDLLAPEEIVVKPLSSVLQQIGLFSGATVLGNGTLALIIDVAEAAERAGVKPSELLAVEPEVAPSSTDARQTPFLIFEDRVEERRALPLSVVERIESIPFSRIEYVKGMPLLQYRGQTLSLQDDGQLLDELRAGLHHENFCTIATVTVLICAVEPGSTRRIGLVVRQVLDVSAGSLLSADVLLGPSQLALVGERLTSVCGDLATRVASQWKEVA